MKCINEICKKTIMLNQTKEKKIEAKRYNTSVNTFAKSKHLKSSTKNINQKDLTKLVAEINFLTNIYIHRKDTGNIHDLVW